MKFKARGKDRGVYRVGVKRGVVLRMALKCQLF